MPDLKRIACTRCGESVYNCMIPGADGALQRVPIVTRIVQGQPADTGPRVPLNDPNTRLTSFTRSLMLTPMPRIELCELCLSEVMGWPLVTAEEDPMYSPDALVLAKHQANTVMRDQTIPLVERMKQIHKRPLQAPAVAWGEAEPEAVDSGVDSTAGDTPAPA